MGTIEQKIKQLPKELQEEVIDFIDFLVTKKTPKKKKIFTLNWIGGLKEFKSDYTALELQKKSFEWRD